MSQIRRVLCVFVLLSSLAAGYFAYVLQSEIPKEQTFTSLSQIPWFSSALMGYCFGTLLVPFGFADVNEPVKRTMKFWALILLFCEAIFLVPLWLATKFGWTWDHCFSISLLFLVVPSLLDPLGAYRSYKQNAQTNDSA